MEMTTHLKAQQRSIGCRDTDIDLIVKILHRTPKNNQKNLSSSSKLRAYAWFY